RRSALSRQHSLKSGGSIDFAVWTAQRLVFSACTNVSSKEARRVLDLLRKWLHMQGVKEALHRDRERYRQDHRVFIWVQGCIRNANVRQNAAIERSQSARDDVKVRDDLRIEGRQRCLHDRELGLKEFVQGLLWRRSQVRALVTPGKVQHQQHVKVIVSIPLLSEVRQHDAALAVEHSNDRTVLQSRASGQRASTTAIAPSSAATTSSSTATATSATTATTSRLGRLLQFSAVRSPACSELCQGHVVKVDRDWLA